MTCELAFLASALKEWRKLTPDIRAQFKKRLAERLHEPRLPSAKLSGAKDRYKIKLRDAGWRLLYEVRDGDMVVLVIAIGKRDRNQVYRTAETR